ncbi:caspase family protein [Mycobacterium sp. 050134]|uniref:caspase family protein n=1 Tax=Mycobacterium sp. 050134 TaxID=3096111 RepID=UPI002EDABB82
MGSPAAPRRGRELRRCVIRSRSHFSTNRTHHSNGGHVDSTKRRSLHIGLNQVDPASYGGWCGELRACEADAKAMADVARGRGFEPAVLLTREATVTAVEAGIRRAAAELPSGGFFFLTYSGHGGQVPDLDGDEATQSGDVPDTMDETWVLYDTQLLDDEIYGALSEFAPGVRIFVLSDSCHSGTITREALVGRREMVESQPTMRGAEISAPRVKWAPTTVTFAEFKAHRDQYEKRSLSGACLALPKSHVKVILMSGCQDWQTSMDGTTNGAFTESFLNAWGAGAFTGNYQDLHIAVKARLPFTQQPNLFAYGDGVENMLLTTPLAE